MAFHRKEILLTEIPMRYFVAFFVVTMMAFFPIRVVHGGSINEETFQRLDNIREDKQQQLFEYLERISKNANAINVDELMQAFFHIKRKYYRLKKSSPPPEKLARLIEDLKKGVRRHYLHNYLSFYDILFIDREGDIFHTIRRQGDYHKNIFEGALAKTTLAKQLRDHPNKTFVDYEYYSASDNPAAFFVEPVMKDARLAGWFVLQCSINKINNMFTGGKGLGATGEVFLVNKQQYMLTESRFSKEPSILNLHMSRKNIDAKFKERSGHKIVIDYRNFRALTSFEVCRIGNSEWLLIAKIDEDEVITEQYRKKRKALGRVLAQSLRKQTPQPCTDMRVESKVVEVDMDEFRKVDNHEMICTYGVSTCTAIIVAFPGRFAYMSHISNLDIVYGGHTTDLIRHIFKRIKTFDIYEYERRKLLVTVIANHLDSIVNIIDKLVAQGLFLSQIKFIYADSEYGNVLHDYLNNQTLIEWEMDKGNGRKVKQCAAGTKSVGEVFKDIIGCK